MTHLAWTKLVSRKISNSLLDEEPWYNSVEELAEVIDYLLTFKLEVLRQVLQHRGAFKSLYRKGRAIVRTIGQEDERELERYERVLTALSNPEHNSRYLTWPYSHLLAHMAGCLKGRPDGHTRKQRALGHISSDEAASRLHHKT